MKIEVTLKDPDGVWESVDEAVRNWKHGLKDEDIAEASKEMYREKLNEKLGKWIEYGEYVTLVIDTEAMTATVKEL